VRGEYRVKGGEESVEIGEERGDRIVCVEVFSAASGQVNNKVLKSLIRC
jgi:hypothetical protein